jgi:hypothetical protein
MFYERGSMQEIRGSVLCESAVQLFPTGIEDFVFRRRLEHVATADHLIHLTILDIWDRGSMAFLYLTTLDIWDRGSMAFLYLTTLDSWDRGSMAFLYLTILDIWDRGSMAFLYLTTLEIWDR